MNEEVLTRAAIRKAFPGIFDNEVETMAALGTIREYSEQICLCTEGRTEETFYILLDGEVEVSKVINQEENRILKHLFAGDFFGEMGLIHDAPRAATVTTVSSVKVLEIDKSSFTETLQQMSMVSVAMVREVSRRLRENDELAIEDLRMKAGELADAYQQLAELDVARREFLTTIAHELRTPLTSANGFLQMVKMGMLREEAMDQALDAISGNLERIIGLTNDILFLQEMDLIFSEFEVIAVPELLGRLIEDAQGFAGEMGVEIRLEAVKNLTPILGDIKSIERTFKALLDNAIKFSLNGGEILVQVIEDGNRLSVVIADEGIGIPEENIARIYERFWRTEEFSGHLFSGIGLGLSIARQVVEQHGGEISVRSMVGEGTAFTVRLPLVKK